MNTTAETELLDKIDIAVKALATAQTEFVSRSKAIGLLLLEARKLHPKREDFNEFLKKVHGLHQSRAYDLMALAGGRITDAELREDARRRKQKSRTKRKLPKSLPTPEPAKDSVTVTETPEASADERRALYAKLDDGADPSTPAPAPVDKDKSANALGEFRFACTRYLPRMNTADQQKALSIVVKLTTKPKAEAA